MHAGNQDPQKQSDANSASVSGIRIAEVNLSENNVGETAENVSQTSENAPETCADVSENDSETSSGSSKRHVFAHLQAPVIQLRRSAAKRPPPGEDAAGMIKGEAMMWTPEK
jgi:hypothetical protein